MRWQFNTDSMLLFVFIGRSLCVFFSYFIVSFFSEARRNIAIADDDDDDDDGHRINVYLSTSNALSRQHLHDSTTIIAQHSNCLCAYDAKYNTTIRNHARKNKCYIYTHSMNIVYIHYYICNENLFVTLILSLRQSNKSDRRENKNMFVR